MKTLKLFNLLAAGILLPHLLMAQAGLPLSCTAEFSIDLDSLTSHPFLYHFRDNSSGNIDSWRWDFGDGTTSMEQNPSHQYEAEGNYLICLTVSSTSSPDSCTDEVCYGISTVKYFSFGGLVYAGDYPLNNPVPEGDTGIASLYRVTDNQVTFVESQSFSDYGYYWFGYVLTGKYMVKIGLTSRSTHYGKYFTTYLGDKVNWNEAGILTIDDASFYDETINLTPVRELATGPGTIKGRVSFEQGSIYSLPPVSQTTVILADKNRTPLIYTYPDATGYFQFSQIPLDTYFISADATGKPSTIITVILTEGAPAAEGINLTIFGGNVSGTPEDFYSGLSIARIFPNPIGDNLSAELFCSADMPVTLRISDLPGKVHFYGAENLRSGMNRLNIPTGKLPAGLYVLTVHPQGKSFPVAVKFIK